VLTSIYKSTHYIDIEVYKNSTAYLKDFVLEEIFKLDVKVHMKKGSVAEMQNLELYLSSLEEKKVEKLIGNRSFLKEVIKLFL